MKTMHKKLYEFLLENNLDNTMYVKEEKLNLIQAIGLIDFNNSTITNNKKRNIIFIENIDTLNSYLYNVLEFDLKIIEFPASYQIGNNHKVPVRKAWKLIRINEVNNN